MANLKQDGKEVGEVFDLTIIPGGRKDLGGGALGQKDLDRVSFTCPEGGDLGPAILCLDDGRELRITLSAMRNNVLSGWVEPGQG